MRKIALVVEDDPRIAASAIQDAFVALDHDFVVAPSLEEARQLFHERKFDDVLLELAIPARASGGSPLKENGLMFLSDVRKGYNAELLPVCAITSQASGFNCALDLARLSVNATAAKPFEEIPLAKVIADMLEMNGIKKNSPAKGLPTSALKPFRAESRVVVLYTDAITVCGEVVWSESGRGADIRKVIAALNKKDEHGSYVCIKGNALEEMLKRNASNKVSRPIKTFRDTATERLAAGRGLNCGPSDIIDTRTGRGYFLQPWVEVKVVDRPYEGPLIQEVDSQPAGPDLTERQRQILAEFQKGANPTIADLMTLTGGARAAVNRDLKVLREAGVVG